MQDFEKLGVFYLGKTEKGPLLYASRHLTTHAVCVGMAGSGKTGFALAYWKKRRSAECRPRG